MSTYTLTTDRPDRTFPITKVNGRWHVEYRYGIDAMGHGTAENVSIDALRKQFAAAGWTITSTAAEATKYLIQITFSVTGIPQYLHSMQKKRLTRTRYASNARGFKTEAEAQAFIDEHTAYFGGKWEVIAHTPQPAKPKAAAPVARGGGYPHGLAALLRGR